MIDFVRRRTLAVLPLLAALSLASCEGVGDPVAPADDDGLRFSYSGAASGSYRSAGSTSLGSDGLPRFGEWAVARADSLGGIVVAGLEPTGESSGNLFILQLRRKETGTYECALHGANGRTCYGTFIVGLDFDDLSRPGEYYFVDAGSVTVTSLTSDRIQGSFGIGMRSARDPDRTITVTDGRIDVPYAEGTGLFNGLACLVENLRSGGSQHC